MIKVLKKYAFVLMLGMFYLPLSAYAYPWQQTGEKLHFNVGVWILKAGDAELIFEPNLEKNSYTITGKAWTNGLGSVVKLRDQIVAEGTLSDQEEPLLTQKYTLQLKENDYRAHKTVVYKHDEKKAVYQNIHAGHDEEPYDMTPLSRDMLSALYYLRAQVEKIEVGKVYTLPVFDVNTQYELNLAVVKKEKIETKFGKRNAYLVTPSLKGVKGRNKKDRWGIWVGDDDLRLPYKISVKMNFGSFEALLSGYHSLGLNQQTED